MVFLCCCLLQALEHLKPSDNCLVGKAPENRDKNRYRDILPCKTFYFSWEGFKVKVLFFCYFHYAERRLKTVKTEGVTIYKTAYWHLLINQLKLAVHFYCEYVYLLLLRKLCAFYNLLESIIHWLLIYSIIFPHPAKNVTMMVLAIILSWIYIFNKWGRKRFNKLQNR